MSMTTIPPMTGMGCAMASRPDLSADQDVIDTAPTPIIASSEEPETAWFTDLDDSDDPGADEPDDDYIDASPESEPEPEPDSGPPSGRHAAIQFAEPVVAETSLRLAADDPFDAPAGYPIKADTKTGLYWLPGTGQYDSARAEIWFASEEFALTNGFTKG